VNFTDTGNPPLFYVTEITMTTRQPDRERIEQLLRANAEVIADIRMARRTDIGRSRRLANNLFDELESLTD
jgi:hypothetical protein